MVVCHTYPLYTLKEYRYVVVLSCYQGNILLSRHKARDTWETQGGHIEPGETPLDAARRELYEESGALEFDLRAFCDYRAENPKQCQQLKRYWHLPCIKNQIEYLGQNTLR